MNKTYNQVKNIFAAPKKSYFLGKAKNDMSGFSSAMLPIYIYIPDWICKLFNLYYTVGIYKFNKRLTLPYWLKLKIVSRDVGYKLKYNSIRHEYNPYIQFQFFYWCFTITYHSPIYIKDECPTSYNMDDLRYYEAILNYIYKTNVNDIPEKRITDCIDITGYWENGKNEKFWDCDVKFIKSEYMQEVVIKYQQKLLNDKQEKFN